MPNIWEGNDFKETERRLEGEKAVQEKVEKE
jgi:hypothetical protein